MINTTTKKNQRKRERRLKHILGGTPHFTHQPGWGIAGVQHRDQSQCQHPGVALSFFFFNQAAPLKLATESYLEGRER